MIGWYVHHHGRGHATRAAQIAQHLRQPVVGFSSLEAPEGWTGQWVHLPSDVVTQPDDPTAGGVLHWAPLNHPGHRERMGLIAQWLRNDITVMVVDVSVEVTLLSRLMGVPTAVLAMRGDRRDRPHEEGYDAATTLIAPWPGSAPEPTWPQRWLDKTHHVGALSRFDERAALPQTSGKRRVLVLWGAGGTGVADADLRAAQDSTPEWEWLVRHPSLNSSPDVWADLEWADVVVTHAGQNAVAEVAAARRSAVVIAQPRPFAEQTATVAALRHLDCCVALDGWPAPHQWPTLLAEASAGTRWQRWSTGGGSQEAAAIINALAGPGT